MASDPRPADRQGPQADPTEGPGPTSAVDGRDEIASWTRRGIGLGVGVTAVIVAVEIARRSTDVLVIAIIAILLAASLDPVVDRIRRSVPISRVQAILLLYVGLVILAGGLLLVIVPTAVDQMTMLSERTPRLIAEIREWSAALEPEVLRSVIERILRAVESLTRSDVVPDDPEMVVDAGITAAEVVISLITILTLIFFWLISREAIQRFALALIPDEQRAPVREAWDRIEGRMGDWLRGQLTLMTTVGVATTIAYLLLGLESAVILGLIAGITEIIPIIGPAIGAVPAIVVALINGGPELALAVVAVYVVIQVVEGQILVPTVMRRSVGLPPFIVILSLLVGTAVAGLAGALLAVPTVAAVVIVLESIQDRGRPVALSGGPPIGQPDDDA